ncbi:hypothetical protein KJ611_03860 [Patescibacteria group bacterium]|nr:hypothetical protein [Patescibacteria group bacterium]MBU1705710.1 hypothetical protein [Patescibacteria group bacterium]
MTPLDILYIVLAFCALWLTAGLFWLVWQVASILRNVNETMSLAQQTFDKIEEAITAIRHKFEAASSTLPLLVGGMKKIIDYAIEKKKGKEEKDEPAP